MRALVLPSCLSLIALFLFAAAPSGRGAPGPAVPASAGPLHFELPLPGLRAEHAGEVAARLGEVLADQVQHVRCQTDQLSFRAGGISSRMRLRLSDLRRALAEVELDLDPRRWVLLDQTVGLHVTARDGIGASQLSATLEGVDGLDLRVAGWIVDGSKACVIVELEGPTGFAALERALERSGVAITDLVWGYWESGWGLQGLDHSHDVRARLDRGI